jgi:acetyltransferase-like isoleucine patch superfamily enzyme
LRIGKGTKVIYGNLDFTGDGSIHLGEDCNLKINFAVRLPESQITVGNRCFIAAGTMVLAADCVEIGNDVLIGEGCYISDNDGHSLDLDIRKQDVANRRKGLKVWDGIAAVPVIIGDNAWIAPRSIILKGVTIGRGAVIGAGSVVTKDVPPMTLAAGNPARIIRTLDT